MRIGLMAQDPELRGVTSERSIDMQISPEPGPEKALKQVAALPVRLEADGSLRVLLITSRETRRWIIPKGWPMKGLTAAEAAAEEARQEAGMVGRIARKAFARYTYLKRLTDRAQRVDVDVFVLVVERQLGAWREQGQRDQVWLTPSEAAGLVDEPGLAEAMRSITPKNLPKRLLKAVAKSSKGRAPTTQNLTDGPAASATPDAQGSPPLVEAAAGPTKCPAQKRVDGATAQKGKSKAARAKTSKRRA